MRPKDMTCFQVRQTYKSLKDRKKRSILKDKCRQINVGQGCPGCPIVADFERKAADACIKELLTADE